MWIPLGGGYVWHTSLRPSRHNDLEAKPVPLLRAEDREDIGNLVLRLEPEAWMTSSPRFPGTALGTENTGDPKMDSWAIRPLACLTLCLSPGSSRQPCRTHTVSHLFLPDLPGSYIQESFFGRLISCLTLPCLSQVQSISLHPSFPRRVVYGQQWSLAPFS